ncbi:MAG: Maf family protein [Candidatus Paracaedibacteraceae bacterium]|nr:Maf family protein [Candidatus Paracaedibacteraceae bacterium]
MNKVIHTPSLILASQSFSRAQILEKAGISFQAKPSQVNEGEIKCQARERGWSIQETALVLARAKARAVTQFYPQDYIIGADQMMQCEGRWFDKAVSLHEATEQLQFMQAKTHILPSACVIFHGGQEIWSTVVTPELVVRPLSSDFIETYVRCLGDEILRSVGCYQVEGLGAQLFEEIKGDIFTIMGLPLLPLMAELRRLGILML